MTKQAQFTGNVYEKEYYDAAFIEIENLSNSLTPEEICKEIYKRMDLTMIIAHKARRAILESVELFRLRVPDEKENHKEDLVHSYFYPPDDVKFPAGRANLANQQVFYASLDGQTPFHEFSEKIKPNETICYLSVWGLKDLPEHTNVRNLFLGIPPGIEDNMASLMATGLTDFVHNLISTMRGNVRENFLYAQEKYSSLFTSSSAFYHLSSAIANDTFVTSQNQGVSMPILTYPSVAKNKSSVNMAIRKDFADRHLYLKRVYKVTLTALDEIKCNITVMGTGVIEEGKIKWSMPKFKYDLKGVFYSDDGQPANMHPLGESESFTMCCAEHPLTVAQVLELIKITEEKIIHALSGIPLDLYTPFPQTYACIIPIKVGMNLYRTNNISESGLIKYINLAIEYSVHFKE